MATINPHINFNGNAEEAFNFYKSVFGGEVKNIIRFKDLPSDSKNAITESDQEKLMNIELPIGANNVLIGNDVPSLMGKVNEKENRSKISIAADSKEEAEKLFKGLSTGGEVEIPMGEAPYFAMFRDRYGIEWIVKFDPSKS